VGLRSLHVVSGETVIEADRFGELFDAGIGLLLKPSAPGFGGHEPGLRGILDFRFGILDSQ
jgi:hypothetical protein